MPVGGIADAGESSCSSDPGASSRVCLSHDWRLTAAASGEGGAACMAEEATAAAQVKSCVRVTAVDCASLQNNSTVGAAAMQIRKDVSSGGMGATLVATKVGDDDGAGERHRQSPPPCSPASAGRGAGARTFCDQASCSTAFSAGSSPTICSGAAVATEVSAEVTGQVAAAGNSNKSISSSNYASASHSEAVDKDVPAWQQETQRQPLIGAKESLTALLKDFKGSELQYAKARTFIIQLRGEQQQLQRDRQRQQKQQHHVACDPGGAGSPVRPEIARDSVSCNENDNSSLQSNHSRTRETDSRGVVSSGSNSTNCRHKVSSKCGDSGSASTNSHSRNSSAGKQEPEGINGGVRGEVAAGAGREKGKVQEEEENADGDYAEEDELLQDSRRGPCIRRVRRDGCCFYRGYMFGLFLYFMKSQHKIKDFIKKIKQEFRPQIRKAGYDMDTVNDFSQEMIDSLEQVEAVSPEDSESETVLEKIFNDVTSSNYLVVFARLLASTHIKLHSELYLPFLASHATVEEFCKHEVDPMWVAAEEFQINALTAMTQVPVEIIYFDCSPGVKPTHHVFPESQKPQIYLLYRPGHYDLLSI